MAGENVQVVEKGDIYFFIRPDVGTTEVRNLDDIQRFYMILNPDQDSKFREIVVGKKKLPDIGEKEKFFAFVDHVFKNADELKDELRGKKYGTRTRGERKEMPAEAVGEGRYVLAQHGDHGHLAYALGLPKKPEKLQKDLGIEEEGNYVISVRNPEEGSQMTDKTPDYPKSIKDEFGGAKFAKKLDPKMLDYENSEFILIGARETPEKDLGIELKPEDESLSDSDLVKELKMQK
jgi:hypothetical protein